MFSRRYVPNNPLHWNYWPLTRLLAVGASLSLQAHLCGWDVPWEIILALPGRVIATLLGLLLFSTTLAYVYAGLWLIPLMIVVLLNDWTYEASRWALRTLFRLRSHRLLAAVSLCSEAALFAGGFVLLRRFFAGF